MLKLELEYFAPGELVDQDYLTVRWHITDGRMINHRDEVVQLMEYEPSFDKLIGESMDALARRALTEAMNWYHETARRISADGP